METRSFSIDSHLANQLSVLAASRDCSETLIMEQALRCYIEEQNWQVHAIREALGVLHAGGAECFPHDAVMSRMEDKLKHLPKP